MATVLGLPQKDFFDHSKTYTWATRPPAASLVASVIYISNIGVNGSYWISNGTFWSPVNGEVTLAQSGASTNLTGTTSETALVTYTLPGGLMSTVGQLEIIFMYSYTNSANSKTMRIKHSAVGGGAGGDTYYSCAVTTTQVTNGICCIHSNNSVSAQKGWGIGSTGPSGLGALSSSLRQFTRGLSNDSDIVLTGQLANSGETLTVESYSIVYRG